MNYKLIYLPDHQCDGEYCFCTIKGFTSPKMATIFAYHHVRCSICKYDHKIRSLGKDAYLKNILKMHYKKEETCKSAIDNILESYYELPDSMEDKWIDCACSSEWMIEEEI